MNKTIFSLALLATLLVPVAASAQERSVQRFQIFVYDIKQANTSILPSHGVINQEELQQKFAGKDLVKIQDLTISVLDQDKVTMEIGNQYPAAISDGKTVGYTKTGIGVSLTPDGEILCYSRLAS